MKRLYIFLSVIAVLFFVFFNCQQPGGSGAGGEKGGGDGPEKWSSQYKIVASDASNGDFFGKSVSISGDYLIVGADGEDDTGNDRGAVYIFHRTGTNTWDAGTKIISSYSGSGSFGYSVSISGDYAIVGAYGEGGGGIIKRGAAYIFRRTGTNTWDAGTKITASDTAVNYDDFGRSVSISGDYAIVGACNKDGSEINSGAAYIFHRTGTNTWDAGTKITASDAGDSDHFGTSVSISGDYAIVGAESEDGSGINKGAVYIFHRTGTNTWDSENKEIATDADDNDYFGWSVSISGDYAIVGAIYKNGAGTFRGAAYIFHRYALNSWESVNKLTAPDAADWDDFGYSVSISGDYAIVGTKYEVGSSRTDGGSAYIFHNRERTNIWDMVKKLTAPAAGDSDYFGHSVSISGDYAIVGAYGEDSGAIDAGAAYILQ